MTAAGQALDERAAAQEDGDDGRLGSGRSWERLVWGVIGIVSVLVVWDLLTRTGLVSDVLISSPGGVVRAARIEYESGILWSEIWATASVWLTGLALAAAVGIVVGLVSGASRIVGHVAEPWLRLLYSIPELALIPILIVWLGLGYTFRVVIVFLSSVFYIAINALAGVRAVENKYFEVAAVYHASPISTFRTVIIPGAFPYILTGLRQGASRALVGAVIAEFLAANNGIGFMITIAGSTLNTSRAMFGVALLGALGIISGELLRRIESRFDGWRVS